MIQLKTSSHRRLAGEPPGTQLVAWSHAEAVSSPGSEAPIGRGHQADVALVQLAVAGDRRAVLDLSKRLEGARRLTAIRATRVVLRGPFDLDDVVQDVLLQAWSSLDRYQGRSSIEGWLWGIVVHVMNAYQKRQLQEQDQHALLSADRRGDVEAAEDSPSDLPRVASAVKDALLRLPATTRDIVLLRAVEGLTYKEIARQRQMSPRAARGRYQRGVDAVRECTGERAQGRSGTPSGVSMPAPP
ncbi:ECF RNA polymerase sigma factor SigR [Planctomycetes bacterium Poly30]|uniref:ECF RNA polymerase sigma factor SigR n=1 Tax=Saltatorellus ferox TaxID=2528018 RepID=A0A518F167_9BACT|nr:ECF RNA polymerase sigma factor SigR [Planctomycetes bacterium Poly30]